MTATQLPAISVAKSPKVATVVNNGDTVSYTFVITNEGNVTLHDVGVSDALTNPSLGAIGTVTCSTGTNGSVTLTPLGTSGDAATCHATFTVNQSGIDAGTITDTATASGTSQLGTMVIGTDTASVTLSRPPPSQ